MERSEFARQLLRFMTRHERFVISGHVRPDGDAVGACTALALALKAMGKEALLCFDGDPSRYTRILASVPALPSGVEIRQAGDCFTTGHDFAFIMVDCSEPERTGRAKDAILYASSSLSVDHHVTGVEAADFSYCEPHTSSACQILYSLFKLAGIEISKEIASALFVGLAYDTGGFRHNNVNAESMAMAADLITAGADSSFLMNYLFYTHSFAEEKALAAAVEKAKLHSGGILISGLSNADFDKIGVSGKAADGVVGKLTEIEEAKVVCFLRETEDGGVRVNMRSKCEVNVARIASSYGGGGHVLAAGCTVYEPMMLVKQHLLEAIRRQMKEIGLESPSEGEA
ncbi:MAG: bifunctional oligoribonuclease/PAP phosphatase NrnA [Firmicutes bacterium]|nr:bifunctional oligoribonuclease/PAP phosphatase NrnA [Bacillota bacterium]